MPDDTLLPLHWRLLHWGPFTALSIITCVSVMTLYCNMQWWPPFATIGGFLNLFVFMTWVFLCLTNFATAALIGPGYVPLHWRPDKREDEQYLQYCEVCEGFKAPRAHHCSKCQRCCMKMDHHCPWINNCCGHQNHAYFVKFLFFAVIGCFHGACILGPSIYYALFRVWYILYGTGKEPRVELGLYGLLVCVLSIGMALGVVIAVGILFIVNLRAIFRNRSGVEEYIIAKAERRPRDDAFIYPYDLGWKANFHQTFGWGSAPPCNGIRWPVKEGCDEYSFTKEQLEQKRLKREMAIPCEVVQPYSGSFCIPRRLGGCRALCTQYQFVGEGRLSVKEGERLLVTRWRRHWCYAQKETLEKPNSPLPKGWLPRVCVQRLEEEDSDESITAENDRNDAETAAADDTENEEELVTVEKDLASGDYAFVNRDIPGRLKKD